MAFKTKAELIQAINQAFTGTQRDVILSLLQPATTETPGLVIVGNNLFVDENGVVSAANPSTGSWG